MATIFNQINSLYHAMCLIRHRADISADQTSKHKSLINASLSEQRETLRIIDEIESVEGIPIESFDERRANVHLMLISKKVLELTKKELVAAGCNVDQGERVLEKLRHDAESLQPDTTAQGGTTEANFPIGQMVVYPNHGLGKIEQVEQKQIGARSLRFYSLRLSANNSLVLVPVSNAVEVGLRLPISADEAERLITALSDDFTSPVVDYADRFKNFSEELRTGDVFKVAEVLKNLTYLSQDKPLSFREQRLFERARYLVVSELSAATHQQERAVGHRIDQAFVRAFAKHRTKTRLIVNSKWREPS